jgi:hypothetical protein
MASLINGFPHDGVVTINRVILKPEYSGFVSLNSGAVSNEGSTVGQAVESPLKGKEALIITFWRSFEEHEQSHKSETFQPLFKEVLELCENGNEEIAYEMLWSGAAYNEKVARAAQEAKAMYAA